MAPMYFKLPSPLDLETAKSLSGSYWIVEFGFLDMLNWLDLFISPEKKLKLRDIP